MESASSDPRFESSAELAATAFGLLISLFYLALAVPGLDRKSAEWFFWGELALLFPLIYSWLLGTARAPLRRVFAVVGGVHLVVSLFLSSYEFFGRSTSGTVFEWSFLPLSALVAAVTLGTCFWIAKRLSQKIGIQVTVLAGFLFCLTRTGEHPVGFPLFHFRYLIDAFLFAGFLWFSWLVFFGKRATGGYSARGKKLWIGFFFLWGLQPIAQLTPTSLHHYSFFAGPIDLVRMGGRLLYDVPSQYGFLSILIPAALPFSALNAFRITLGLMLAAQAWLVFEGLLTLPLKRYRLTWAGLTSAVLVFLLPGDHSELGAFTFPNTGAFRFLPSFVAAWLLAKRDRVPRWGLALAFAVGCFWSLESAVFCFGAWGYAVLAELFCLAKGARPRAEIKRAMPRFLTPPVGVVAFAAFVEIFYRLYFGIPPEWSAFREFSAVYTQSFALSPIDPRSALNLLTALLALFSACLFVELKRTRGKALAGSFAYLGLIVATVTYFVARSEPINAITLIAFWLAVYFVAIPLFYDELSAEWKNTVVASVFLFSVVFIPFSLPNPMKRNLGKFVAQWAMVAGVVPYEPYYPAQAAVEAARDPKLPLMNLTFLKFPVPAVSVPSFRFQAWSPVHPAEQFCILPLARRDVYLRRFLAWHTPVRAHVLRSDIEEDCDRQTLRTLSERYVLEKRQSLGQGILLETYGLR